MAPGIKAVDGLQRVGKHVGSKAARCHKLAFHPIASRHRLSTPLNEPLSNFPRKIGTFADKMVQSHSQFNQPPNVVSELLIIDIQLV